MANFNKKSIVEAPFEVDPRFGLYLGVVTQRNDPSKLGRIKFRVPGLIEPESGWTQPIGMFASDQQGIAWVPEVGALVYISFHQGNTRYPFYIAGPWAAPATGNEFPTESQVDPDIKTIKTKKFKIVFDDTTTAKLSIESLSGDTKITLDDVAGSIKIESSATVEVKTTSGDIDLLTTSGDINVKPTSGDVELGDPAAVQKRVAHEGLIASVNAAKFGGFSIDVPIVATPGVAGNVSTNVKASE